MQETQTANDTGGARHAVRRKVRRTVGRLRRGRADERGLTTLEWLLIVAAVAGLAALAVVLVQNVVDETAEDIGGQSARGTAARVAAERITREARAALPTAAQRTAAVGSSGTSATEDATAAIIAAQNAANDEYGSACGRLQINYGDIDNFMSTWTPAEVAEVGVITSGNRAISGIGTAGTLNDRNEGARAPQTGEDFTEARCFVNIGTP